MHECVIIIYVVLVVRNHESDGDEDARLNQSGSKTERGGFLIECCFVPLEKKNACLRMVPIRCPYYNSYAMQA